jgi:hypothetical protein
MNTVVPVGDDHFVTSNPNPPFSASSIEDPGATWELSFMLRILTHPLPYTECL